MDTAWERAIPLHLAEISQIQEVFYEFDNTLTVLSATPINIGCRNSNYMVETDQKRYFMRICPSNATSFMMEVALFNALDKNVQRAELLYISETNATGRVCLIYEYIHGISLQIALEEGLSMTEDIITQVAQNAAWIHSSMSFSELGFFDSTLSVTEKLPPFPSWYELFMGENAIGRLGREVITRLKKLVADHADALNQIDQNYCLYHGDFRPANMLLTSDDRIVIVDWEFAGAGHPIADVGQFFRYTSFFTAEHFLRFRQVYNIEAKHTLPDNWYALARLRDLVNLLQMINGTNDQPKKYFDLRNLISETLRFFNY